MVAKSIVDIDVNDDKFVAFMERFREYQSALDDLPEAWRVAAVGIGESSKQTEKAKGEAKELGAEFNAVAEAILTINSGIDRLNTNLEDSKKKQDEFNKSTKIACRAYQGSDGQPSVLGWYCRDIYRRPGRWRPVWHQPSGGHHRRPAVYFSRARDEYRRA